MKKLITHLFFAITLCLLSINSYAQDGSNDATFNPGTGANNNVSTMVLQSDGKILIGGAFTNYNGTTRKYIARLNTDGTLDANFIVGAGTNYYVNAIAIQSDGKILIGGGFISYDGTTQNRIARLNTDGSLDATFNPTGTGANNVVNTIAIQSDGKILIGGYFTSYNGITKNRIARLNTDGSLDAAFNSGTGANNYFVNTIALQSDGKILIGGGFSSYNGTTKNRIARLNTDGSLDTGFAGTGTDHQVLTIAIQSDGKILIGGDFSSYNNHQIARLNTDGTLDATFNPTRGGVVHEIAIQSDGKILVGSDLGRIVRLNTDGTADTGFTGTGVSGTTDNNVYAIALQSDGKILIGGRFTSYNGVGRNYVARINNTIITGIDDNAQQDATGLSVFPNPSNGAVTIQLNKEETFSLYNCLGQIVRTIQLNQNTRNSANISGLEPGIYFLTGHSNTLLNYKIIVE